MSDPLFVHFEQHTIGKLSQNDSGRIQFHYHPDWIDAAGAFPISLSLPFDGSFTASDCHHYFANLLPEGNVRQQICKSLGISPDNDFELLKAIGGDCAGALEITESAEPGPTDNRPRYEVVSDEQLAQWSIGAPDAFSDVTGHSEVRLSLAGAQDKLPVYVDGQQILIPHGRTPSTHILKFASPFYSHLPENETFVTLLAHGVGLPAADVKLRKTTKASVAVVTRYDRVIRDGKYHRLNQEDFCQALGIGASSKYEKEGGPSLKQCAEVIRRHTAFPLIELQRLLHWALFNLLVGNADAHGKNLSLLYDRNGTLSLAPFYDLVCTRNYRKISRHLAMPLGGASDPDLVGTQHLQSLAAELSVRPSVVINALNGLIEQIPDAISTAVTHFAEQFGDSPVLERLPIIMRKQIRRVKSQLR